jgi:hypothetical protein
MLPYRSAVRASDRGRVEQLLESGYGDGKCWLADPTWMAEVKAHEQAWQDLSPARLAAKYE